MLPEATIACVAKRAARRGRTVASFSVIPAQAGIHDRPQPARSQRRTRGSISRPINSLLNRKTRGYRRSPA